MTTRVREIRRDGNVVSGIVEYDGSGRSWRHAFESELLNDDQLSASLRGARLHLSEVLDDRRRWVVARPLMRD